MTKNQINNDEFKMTKNHLTNDELINQNSIFNWLLKFGCYFVIGFSLLVIPTASLAVEGGLVSDPSLIGVGARSLGMGRAFVGVAEDGDAVFVNPAGLARIGNLKMSSMYTSLLNEVGYVVVSGAYPIGDRSALGLGVINSSASDIQITDSTGLLLNPNGRWSNSVMFLSYGTYLNSLPLLAVIEKDILVGGSLKYFSVGGSGTTEIENAAGTGYSADFGLIYPVMEYLTLGANYQNALGGNIDKGSGVSEKVNSKLKIGSKVTLIGKEGHAFSDHQNRKLYLNLDYDLVPGAEPNVAHYGLEFWPNSNLAFRTGVDDSEWTAGMGLRYGGIEFNYAYHPFHGIAENNTQFFSFSYLGEAGKRELRVHIDKPLDKSVIHDDNITIAGHIEVVEPEVEEEIQSPLSGLVVKVNGVNVIVNKDLTFSGEVPIKKVGKNMFVVEAEDSAGNYYASNEIRIIRLIQFADVPEGHWAMNPIENTGTVGLIQGYPDGNFQPDKALTRAELATLLVRAKNLPLPDRRAEKVFPDVDSDFWAAKYIEVAYKAGLIKGYSEDNTFRPNREISNAEGVAVLVRFDNLAYPTELVENPYPDVPQNFWAAKAIQAAKEKGMLSFVEANSFKPENSLVRSEMVQMLSTTALAGQKIEDLYSWEKGFIREYKPTKPGPRAGLLQAAN